MGPTGRYRVLQIHPTRRCNLTCLHCYSASGPDQREELGIETLREALEDAAAEGYDVAGISGGEPLLYAELASLVQSARTRGFLTTVTTNGMLATDRALSVIAPHLDLLAISLDGTPSSHERMRASPRAFSAMAGRLESIRAAGIPFGFIFTLTQYNLDELDWVVDFAVSSGARLLQVHPLEEVGRARERLRGSAPDGYESSSAYLQVLRAQARVGEALRIQLDLVPLPEVLERPELVFAGAGNKPDDFALAELISPLVIEPDGAVVPLQFGFGRRYMLGRLGDERLAVMASRWRATGYPEFARLCQRVYSRARHQRRWPLFNWYEAVTRASRSADSAVDRAALHASAQ